MDLKGAQKGKSYSCDSSLVRSKIDRLLTTSFNNNNTKTILDNLSNESSTNSSGFHSKSTTTIFNNEYSPRVPETVELSFSGVYPLYKGQYQMNV
ncbi:unnamed protein product [Rotaria sp. Silwood1]|nr:unnamed protein product [Rotaria sp. Silwood1]CAF4669885.1 unnamed protein product [Rotaria sp. Silwood1]